MSDYECVKDYWPEDPRWGESVLKPPLNGKRDSTYLKYINEAVQRARQTVGEFEEKYPDHAWWKSGFVESHPATALLLQSVNDTTIFASQAAFMQLADRIAEQNRVPFINHKAKPDVQIARLALTVLLQQEGKELAFAHSIMTEGDRLELSMLINGVSRVVVSSA